MEKVQKPSNSECDTPSSEPFRIYLNIDVFYSHICNDLMTYLPFVTTVVTTVGDWDTRFAEARR
jgi:hypothetical protein